MLISFDQKIPLCQIFYFKSLQPHGPIFLVYWDIYQTLNYNWFTGLFPKYLISNKNFFKLIFYIRGLFVYLYK